MKQTIGKVVMDDTFYPGKDLYSDGRVEDEILKLVRQHPESEYPRVIAQRASWPVLYHLSHLRWNIVEWLPVTKAETVLEIGSGCGAVTGALAKKAKSVTCIDLSKKRSTINAVRNQERENIEILLGNFQEVEGSLTQKYDWITLIGVLEYGQLYIASEQPHVDFLKIIRKHLAPGGRIVIAIENRLGLKYFAGCTEDHTGNYFEGVEGYVDPKQGVRTFSRPELEKICKEAGLPALEFYYPYPDYKLPTTMYSDRYLPKTGELRDNMRNFDRERYLLFDEARTYDSLIKDGLYPLFSNSYLVIAGEEPGRQELIYTKYSNERGAKFAIRTDILDDGNGGTKVRKTPCGAQGEEHVRRIAGWYEKLSALYEGTPISMNRVKYEDGGVDIEFLHGHTLEEELDQKLATGDTAAVTAKLLEYIEVVRSVGGREKFEVTPQFLEVFGEANLPEHLMSAPVTDLDLVVGNAVVTEEGWTLIDYEWTFDFPIPVNYVIYRILYFYIFGNSSRAALYSENLYEKAGLTPEEVREYWEMEEHFQQYVLDGMTPLRLLYPKISEGHIDLRAEDAKRKQNKLPSPGRKEDIILCIDRVERAPAQICVEGWAVSREGGLLNYVLLDEQGHPLKTLELKRSRRKDVNAALSVSGENGWSGFRLVCEVPAQKQSSMLRLTLRADGGSASVSVQLWERKLKFLRSFAGRALRKVLRRGGGHRIQYVVKKSGSADAAEK